MASFGPILPYKSNAFKVLKSLAFVKIVFVSHILFSNESVGLVVRINPFYRFSGKLFSKKT